MEKKKYIIITLLLCAFLGVFSENVYGDVPTVTSLEFNEDSDTLTMEIRHANPSSIHYINEINVEVNGEVETIEVEEPQSATRFTETYEVKENIETLRVRVHCTTHGWSPWAEFEVETQEDEGNGIPGFPTIATIAGLIIVVFYNSRKNRFHNSI